MAAYLAPIGNEQQSDANGAPVSGALIYTYLAGTSTPVTTYSDAAGVTPQTNPIVCNAAGYPSSPIYLPAGVAVKMVFTTSVASGSVAYRPSVDNIQGVNDPSFATTISEWTAFSGTPTYISATSFSVTGDQTNTLQVGRQIKSTNTGGTTYSTITASVFGAVTTVTVSNVSGTLDSGLSAVSYGLLAAVNPSLPNSAAARTSLGAGAVGAAVFVSASRDAAYAALGPLRTYISGLTYGNNAADATNDIDIFAGEASDGTNAVLLSLGSTLTKRLDAAWAVGTGNGGLDTGSIGNSDYYIWLIGRTDRTADDVLFSLSSTAPSMPTDYTYKRLIGWFKRVGGTIVAFTTYETEGGGLELSWNVPTLDINLANTLTTARRTDAVKVPLNFSTEAILNISASDAATGFRAWFYNPDQSDAAPSTSVAPLANFSCANIAAGAQLASQYRIRTSSTGTIAARADVATVDLYAVSTMGFRWARKN